VETCAAAFVSAGLPGSVSRQRKQNQARPEISASWGGTRDMDSKRSNLQVLH
jgi:hypothetical protein